MKRLLFLIVCCAGLMIDVPLRGAASQSSLCILRTSAATLQGVLNRYGLQLVDTLDATREIFLVAEPAGADPATFDAQVRQDPDVKDCEDVYPAVIPENAASLNQSNAAPSAPWSYGPDVVSYFGDTVWRYYADQPATGLIRLGPAHLLATGTGVVAVIDTGVDPNHPALKRSLVPGYDFVNNLPGSASEWVDLTQSTAAILDQNGVTTLSTDATVILNQSTAAILDQSTAAILDTRGVPAAFGHGTMVAGIIHLVAPSAQIMPLKAFRSDGTSDSYSIIRAIYYAVDHGADVINMSFSMFSPSQEIMRAINYAADHGVICVASAGNNGRDVLAYPAAFRNVLGVAATSLSDHRSDFSNYGSSLVTLAAPGEAIVTTYPGGHYAMVWGTSFSAPFVSGAPALLLQVDKKTTFRTSADSLAHCKQLSQEMGYGRIDLQQMLIARLDALGKF